MRVRPVLDLLEGVVVRGIGGRRDEYRPIVSGLTAESSPLAVARSLSDHFGFRDFYIADLDAILHARPNLNHLRELARAGFRLAVDAGVKTPTDVDRLLGVGVETVILGLESLESPELLAGFIETPWKSRLLFSLDLQNGRPLATPLWPASASEIAAKVLACGIDRLLILDLADVGTGRGGSTQRTVGACRGDSRCRSLWAGGGVRSVGDLERWFELQVDEVLVASALHDGRLSVSDVAPYAG